MEPRIESKPLLFVFGFCPTLGTLRDPVLHDHLLIMHDQLYHNKLKLTFLRSKHTLLWQGL